MVDKKWLNRTYIRMYSDYGNTKETSMWKKKNNEGKSSKRKKTHSPVRRPIETKSVEYLSIIT